MCIRARLNYSKFAVFVTCSHGIKCDVSITARFRRDIFGEVQKIPVRSVSATVKFGEE